MINKDIHIKIEKLYENEISEIDFLLKDKFGFDYESGEFHENYTNCNDMYVHPMHIDDMIAELQNIKSKGCTHASIDYHEDHIGYIFEGYKIEKMTPKEVKELEEKKRKERERLKEERIKILEKSLLNLKRKHGKDK